MCRPETVEIKFFSSHWDGWAYRYDRALIFLLGDGGRIQLREPEYQGEINFDEHVPGDVVETMRLDIPYLTFVRLARATSVEMRIGATELSIPDEELLVWREMIRKVEEASVGGR